MFFKKKKNNEYDSYEDDIYENEETIDSYGETDYNSNSYDDYDDLEEKPRRKRKGKRFK